MARGRRSRHSQEWFMEFGAWGGTSELGGGKWRWRTENVETQDIRLEAVYTVPLRGGLFVCFILSARLL